MTINTNYSNQQSAVNFQARLKVEVPVKDLKRLANISKAFEKNTEKYANDTLTLRMSTDSEFPNTPIVTTNVKMRYDTECYSHMFDDINEMFNTKSDKSIVKKLVNYFKMLKAEESFDKKTGSLNDQIETLGYKIQGRLAHANKLEELGETKFADQFRAIATSMEGKRNKLLAQREKQASGIVTSMEKISDEEADLRFITRDFYNQI